MAPDEYSTGGGGKLKLKGVSDGRVDKKKKKKAKKEKENGKDGATGEQAGQVQAQWQNSESGNTERAVSREREHDDEAGPSAAKTEAERKYEEVRRKRVC